MTVKGQENSEAKQPQWLTVQTILAGSVVCATCMLAAALFLPKQSLWIDEVVQLSGLTLGPVEVVTWLADPSSKDFGLPGDRMPPLSYWLGWLWAKGFGLTETSLRWFGVLCATLAAGLVFDTARRTFNLCAAWGAGLMFALSPNVAYLAVEIRAYPLFLLTSAGAFHSFLALLPPSPQAKIKWWIALTLWLLIGVYTHFFGVVLAGSILSILFLAALFHKQKLWPVLSAAAIVVVLSAGIGPFVQGSAGLAGSLGVHPERNRIREVVQLLYRLIGHPSMAVYPVVVALAIGAVAALGLAGLLARRDGRLSWLALTSALGLGLGVSIAANFMINGFTAAKVSYSAWALPGLCVAASAGLAAPKRWVRATASAAMLVLLICEACGLIQLRTHGEYFAHGPHDRIRKVIEHLGPPREIAVVHDEGSRDYVALYFPFFFSYGNRLTQFVVVRAGDAAPVGHSQPLHPGDETSLAPYHYLVVIRARQQGAAEIGEQIRHGDQGLGSGSLAHALEGSEDWRCIDQGLFVALIAADFKVFERRNSDFAPSTQR